MAGPLALLLGLLAAAQAPEDRRAHYDVLAYALDVEVEPEPRRLSGSVRVDLRALRPLEVVELDLVAGLEVEGAAVGDASLRVEREGDRLACALPAPLAEGETLSLTVRYAGHPRARDAFGGFHWRRAPGGEPWIGTSCQLPGAHLWWPCKASAFHPEDKPERVSVWITAPAGLTAVSNGRLDGVDELEGERRRWRWEHPYPLPTYSVTLNVGPYVEVAGEIEVEGVREPVPWLYWVLPQSVPKAELQFEQVPRLLRAFGEAFGPYPFPRAKFGVVETSFWGMEHSSAIAYGSSFPEWCRANEVEDPWAARNRDFDYILVHETAHEWWGNAVTARDWGDFWLHEGLATYAEGVWIEHERGRDAADAWFAEQALQVLPLSTLARPRGASASEAYDPGLYVRGACVLHTWRHYVDDDERWWRALQLFQERHRYGNASTEDLRAAVAAATDRDWRRFVRQWIEGEGVPLLSGSVAATDDALLVEIQNAASGANGFHLPLDLRWRAGGEERTARLWLDEGAFNARLPTSGRPTDVEVLHLDRLLGRHGIQVR